MHELSLAESAIRIVERQSLHEPFTRVLRVRLEIGRLSHVDADALRFCFAAAASGSRAAGAELVIERTAGAGRCSDCGAAFAVEERFDPCPGCGGHRIELEAGTEMRVMEIEVE